MGQNRFLSDVHQRVRIAAETGEMIDAYGLADALMAENLTLTLSRREAADTVVAAAVVYGACLLLDPDKPVPPEEPRLRPAAAERLRAAQPAPAAAL